jgi:predicted RNA-binding protein with PIN domain
VQLRDAFASIHQKVARRCGIMASNSDANTDKRVLKEGAGWISIYNLRLKVHSEYRKDQQAHRCLYGDTQDTTPGTSFAPE